MEMWWSVHELYMVTEWRHCVYVSWCTHAIKPNTTIVVSKSRFNHVKHCATAYKVWRKTRVLVTYLNCNNNSKNNSKQQGKSNNIG